MKVTRALPVAEDCYRRIGVHAVELKAVDSVLSLVEIAPALIRACRPRS